MASLTKRCRHRGAQRETCGCTWYIRQRQAGRDTYTPVGADRAKAERALARLSRRRDEPAARHDTRRPVLRGDLPWLSIPPGE